MYYCFGCGAGGNVFTFLMNYENDTFPEAIKTLADRAGIDLPEIEYSEEMKKEAAEKINARFNKDTNGSEETITEEQEKPPQAKFEPKKGKMRKPGTGCISKINDHIYEGRYSPKDAYGKRMARNIYAPTREECEEKLAILIKEMKAEIAEQKAKLKNA